MSRRTNWFDATRVKPVREGYYEINSKASAGAQRYWDGETWLVAQGFYRSVFGNYRGDKWRGLSEEPK